MTEKPLLSPCELCDKLPGMLDSLGQYLCPRCAREMGLTDLMADHLIQAVQHHVMPQLEATIRAWAGHWMAAGLLTPDHAASTAEWGLSRAFTGMNSDWNALAKAALTRDKEN